MAIEVMQRYESKYLIDCYTYLRLLDSISQFTQLDHYNRQVDFYTISNLYYDTLDDALIRRSISKPTYKEKLRLRSYGVPDEGDKVFLEIKKKYKGVVNKRRTTLELSEAYDFLQNGTISPNDYSNRQVLNELEYFLELYKPVPKLYLAYDRRAYFGDNGLRITFDTNIRTRRYDLRLESGDHGEALLNGDQWLMEIKAQGAMPLWLTTVLSENKVYSSSFSKYGTEYKQYVKKSLPNYSGGVVCLNQFLKRLPRKQPQYLGRVSLL